MTQRRPITYNPEERKETIRLVKQAKSGDQDAMARLIEQSEQMVYINCLRLLKDPEEARDMAQEVFLTVFLKLDTLKKPEAFFEWVKIITVNKCRNKLKENNPYFFLEDMNGPAQSLYEEKDEGDPYARFEDRRDQISPDKYLDKKEVQDLVIHLIDDLPDAQRMVLILFYYDDYSIREIARIMEISEGTVKSRLAYGRLALKKALEKEKKKGNILFGRTPVTFLAYIAHFLKKSLSDNQDELSALKGTVSAAAGASASSTGTAATGAATTSAGGSVISAADSLAVQSANAFISGGLSLKGLSLTALWTTAWGKAVVTTVAGAVLIGSVAGGISIAAKAREPEPVLVEVQGTIQETRESSTEENSIEEEVSDSMREAQEEPVQEERAQAVPENTTETSSDQSEENTETLTAETEASTEEPVTTAVVTEQSEAYEEIVETTESAESTIMIDSTPETTESSTEPEQQASEQSEAEKQSSVAEESSTLTEEELLAELEETLEREQANLIGTQANYDNALEDYEDTLAWVENDLSEGRKICERERNSWKVSYESMVAYNEQEGIDYYSEEEIAEALSYYQKWQGLYDFMISATAEDAKNQIFPEDFDNLNVSGAILAEKAENLAVWQTLLDENKIRLEEAQAALDAAKQ